MPANIWMLFPYITHSVFFRVAVWSWKWSRHAFIPLSLFSWCQFVAHDHDFIRSWLQSIALTRLCQNPRLLVVLRPRISLHMILSLNEITVFNFWSRLLNPRLLFMNVFLVDDGGWVSFWFIAGQYPSTLQVIGRFLLAGPVIHGCRVVVLHLRLNSFYAIEWAALCSFIFVWRRRHL